MSSQYGIELGLSDPWNTIKTYIESSLLGTGLAYNHRQNSYVDWVPKVNPSWLSPKAAREPQIVIKTLHTAEDVVVKGEHHLSIMFFDIICYHPMRDGRWNMVREINRLFTKHETLSWPVVDTYARLDGAPTYLDVTWDDDEADLAEGYRAHITIKVVQPLIARTA